MKKYLKTILLLALSMCIVLGCAKKSPSVSIRIGSLKGPTTIGLLKLMDDSENSSAKNEYSFEMATAADELLPKMISGELDIALVPANVAAVLYNKTEGAVKVIDINTLGVLYAVSGDNSIQSVQDLSGKTIYITNKGTTPDYVTRYLLEAYGLSLEDVCLEYKSEATEVAAILKENPEAVGILPQPFVTAACIQNEALSPVLDLTAAWDEVNGENGSRLVTGVTVVRKEFLEKNEDAVKIFLEEHKASASFVTEDIDNAAALVVSKGIIEKEPVAKKAVPKCNVTFIEGSEMKEALSGYLSVLFDMDPTTVGGSLPGEDFYY